MKSAIAHTAQLSRAELAAIGALLYDAFGDEMTEEDRQHALGGMHALLWEDGELIGHASVIQRQLLHAGRTFRTGYVEGVAVRPDRQRRGHGGALIAAIDPLVRGGYELGALGATDAAAGLYEAHGWRRWRGPTAALTPDGIVPTPHEDGSIYVLEVEAQLDLDGELVCDWRAGDAW